MRIFLSAGEPSGDLHGANLARALRQIDPGCRLDALGGDRMADAGCHLLYPLASHAVMGFVNVLKVVPEMFRLLDRVTRHLRRTKPDAVVLIDYPGFHWWLADRAHRLGIPVVSFVPPQIWGWASYRVGRVRKNFDHVLCTLPFEEPWFRTRGVASAHYIGHPYFDELPRQRLDPAFMAEQRRRGGAVVGMLPGSRGGEVRENLPTLIGTAKQIAVARPDTRFLFACFKDEHREYVAGRVTAAGLEAEVHAGRTPEIIEASKACVAVSGSVGLELLYRAKPTVVVYKTTPFYKWLTRRIMNVPYISLVNLLADRVLFPEFLMDRDDPTGPARHVTGWLDNPLEYEERRRDLLALKHEIGEPGACWRAATYIAERVVGTRRRRRAA